ncbi:hypothetical protein AG1IA_08787 [Rhizoctonia solani AG-1 IA]|uniref:Uncharacterized protein n=1 Tax=Thanatephorus cucumeris (strain AG1-IA) TaxID=983506 RepID=L8WK45_THACA|nr:hypothetical protein AG1IA_08787 [Rhizoctonia solani AG-1 IA]
MDIIDLIADGLFQIQLAQRLTIQEGIISRATLPAVNNKSSDTISSLTSTFDVSSLRHLSAPNGYNSMCSCKLMTYIYTFGNAIGTDIVTGRLSPFALVIVGSTATIQPLYLCVGILVLRCWALYNSRGTVIQPVSLSFIHCIYRTLVVGLVCTTTCTMVMAIQILKVRAIRGRFGKTRLLQRLAEQEYQNNSNRYGWIRMSKKAPVYQQESSQAVVVFPAGLNSTFQWHLSSALLDRGQPAPLQAAMVYMDHGLTGMLPSGSDKVKIRGSPVRFYLVELNTHAWQAIRFPHLVNPLPNLQALVLLNVYVLGYSRTNSTGMEVFCPKDLEGLLLGACLVIEIFEFADSEHLAKMGWVEVKCGRIRNERETHFVMTEY